MKITQNKILIILFFLERGAEMINCPFCKYIHNIYIENNINILFFCYYRYPNPWIVLDKRKIRRMIVYYA
ncbi:hypothetical protein SCITRI_00615 [Spiroplasma citri]|nr:hypothetical protein SCITRI_00615 [Spiroplasma citri]